MSSCGTRLFDASVTFVSETKIFLGFGTELRQNVRGQILVFGLFGDVLTIPFNEIEIWMLCSSLDDDSI